MSVITLKENQKITKEEIQDKYFAPRIRDNSCLYDSFFGLYGGLPIAFTEELSAPVVEIGNTLDSDYNGEEIIKLFDGKIAQIIVGQKNNFLKITRKSFDFLHKKTVFIKNFHSTNNSCNKLGESTLGNFILGSKASFIQ